MADLVRYWYAALFLFASAYTLFEDGTKVQSKENRVVIFDSQMRHAGIPCTDEKRRVVINFNFI